MHTYAYICKQYCSCPDCKGRHRLRQWIASPVDDEGIMPEIPQELKEYLVRESERRVARMVDEFLNPKPLLGLWGG